MGAKEKVEDGSKSNDVVDLSDTDKRSFQVLWEIFTICYEGYFGFTISTLLCLFLVCVVPVQGKSVFYNLHNRQRTRESKTCLHFVLLLAMLWWILPSSFD